jgi:iron complex outermembrane receptor protein
MTVILDYSNASRNRTGGVELMASYKRPKLTADWNLTWTHTFRSNLIDVGLPANLAPYYSYDIDDNNNTPAIVSNLVLGWQATPQLRLHTHVLFEGRQTSYNIDLENYARSQSRYIEYAFYVLVPGMEEKAAALWEDVVTSAGKIISHQEMPARCILNIGGEYTFGPVTIGLDIHNLLDTRYNRSGMNTGLVPQQGRWFLATLGVRI